MDSKELIRMLINFDDEEDTSTGFVDVSNKIGLSESIKETIESLKEVLFGVRSSTSISPRFFTLPRNVKSLFNGRDIYAIIDRDNDDKVSIYDFQKDRIIFHNQFDEIKYMNDNDRAVLVTQFGNRKYNILRYDFKSGLPVLVCRNVYDYITQYRYDADYTVVKNNNSYNIIDVETGNEILPDWYDEIWLKHKYAILKSSKGEIIFDLKKKQSVGNMYFDKCYPIHYAPDDVPFEYCFVVKKDDVKNICLDDGRLISKYWFEKVFSKNRWDFEYIFVNGFGEVLLPPEKRKGPDDRGIRFITPDGKLYKAIRSNTPNYYPDATF